MNKQTRRLLYMLLLLALLTLSGCRAWLVDETPPPAPETFKNDLLFTSQVAFTDGSTIISLQVVNTSQQRFPGDDDFEARMELREALSNELRASAEAYQLGPLDSGERDTLIIWEGPMEPGRYLLSWGAQDYSFTTTDFEVR